MTQINVLHSMSNQCILKNNEVWLRKSSKSSHLRTQSGTYLPFCLSREYYQHLLSAILSSKRFPAQWGLEDIDKCICSCASTTVRFQPNQPPPSPGDTVSSFLPVCLTPVTAVPRKPPSYQLSVRVQGAVSLNTVLTSTPARWLTVTVKELTFTDGHIQ